MRTTVRPWILVVLAAGGGSQSCALEPSRCVAEELGEAGKTPPPREMALSGRAQGTTYHIRYWQTDARLADAEVQSAVDALLTQIDSQMSTYRQDSELSRFNRAAPNEWFAVSPATAQVVAAALKYNRLTGGAQDLTVLPLLRLWHFGPDAKTADEGSEFDAPTAEELGRTLALVGAEKIRVRAEPPALRKDLAGVEIDLSSIAPGYAVDAIGKSIASRGIASYMVELGGEVRAAGLRPDGEPWRIGIESPWPVEKPMAHTLPLHDLSLSTSGDYRKVRRVGDQRYTHIIDPHSGRPLPFRGVAVTVVAPTCIEADGLSTGVFVMGPTAGYDWCVGHGIAALFQSRGAGRGEVIEQATPQYLAIFPANSATRSE